MESPTKIKQEPIDDDVEQKFVPPASDGIEERIKNAENHLNVSAHKGTKTIFERLKSIEDRIMYLETVSPEYNHFMVSDLRWMGLIN